MDAEGEPQIGIDDLEADDVPFPSVIEEDNPEWLALIAKMESESKQSRRKKKSRGIALVPA